MTPSTTLKIVGFRRAPTCQEHPNGCGVIEEGDWVTFRDALFRGEECVTVHRDDQGCDIGYLAKEHVGTRQFNGRRAVVVEVDDVEGGTKTLRRAAWRNCGSAYVELLVLE